MNQSPNSARSTRNLSFRQKTLCKWFLILHFAFCIFNSALAQINFIGVFATTNGVLIAPTNLFLSNIGQLTNALNIVGYSLVGTGNAYFTNLNLLNPLSTTNLVTPTTFPTGSLLSVGTNGTIISTPNSGLPAPTGNGGALTNLQSSALVTALTSIVTNGGYYTVSGAGSSFVNGIYYTNASLSGINYTNGSGNGATLEAVGGEWIIQDVSGYLQYGSANPNNSFGGGVGQYTNYIHFDPTYSGTNPGPVATFTFNLLTNYSYLPYLSANGSGLTNLSPSSFRATNSPANGYALRYTNGTFYWAP